MKAKTIGQMQETPIKKRGGMPLSGTTKAVGTKVLINVHPLLLETLDNFCLTHHLTRNAAVREAIRHWLQNQGVFDAPKKQELNWE